MVLDIEGLSKFHAYQTIVEGRRQLFQIEPNVESAAGRNVDLKAYLFETLENMVPFMLEMLLQCDLQLSYKFCTITSSESATNLLL